MPWRSRAALREDPETLPAAHLDEEALELEAPRSTTARTSSALAQQISSACAGTCTISGPSWRCRPAALTASAGSSAWPASWPVPSRALGCGSPARWWSRSVARSRRATELEAEIAALVEEQAAALLELKGCGVLTAAKLIAKIAGAARFGSEAKFARLARWPRSPPPRASASVTASTVAATASSTAPCTGSRSARDAPTPRHGSSSSESRPRASPGREALRCLKRHLARRVWKLLIDSERRSPRPLSILREARRRRNTRWPLDIGATEHSSGGAYPPSSDSFQLTLIAETAKSVE